MKKYIIVLAVFAVTALTACGNGSTSNEKTDSTSVNADSTSVKSTDSTEVVTPTDSTKEEVK